MKGHSSHVGKSTHSHRELRGSKQSCPPLNHVSCEVESLERLSSYEGVCRITRAASGAPSGWKGKHCKENTSALPQTV